MDSLKTIGKVEPLEANGHMHWAQAGVTLFTFAAPSAVMSVPFAIANAGFLGGMAICVVITCASVAGADMLLQIKLQHPECGNFGDLGLKIYGQPGQIFGNLIQLGNFCLFMPCALRFCAESLQGIGILGLSCTDYYVWIVALFCLLTTQVRTLSNAQVFTLFSAGCVVGMVVCMLVAAFQYQVAEKVPAQWVGNPAEDPALLLVRFASGCSISAWAYVPAFLTVELSTCMKSPADFRKSLVFAAGLNVMIFLVVGTCVAARWGFAVGEVITITVGVGAWVQGTVVNTLFSIFQLGGNFVSYMLDSVPLCRHCQQSWDPNFQDTWSAADMLRYLGHTLPTFILALVLATFTPSVGTLLDFVTALTTPWVSQIYPAMLFWEVLRQRGSVDTGAKRGLFAERAVTLCVLLVGVLSFALCSMKAVGYLAIEELRPDFHVGCSGW